MVKPYTDNPVFKRLDFRDDLVSRSITVMMLSGMMVKIAFTASFISSNQYGAAGVGGLNMLLDVIYLAGIRDFLVYRWWKMRWDMVEISAKSPFREMSDWCAENTSGKSWFVRVRSWGGTDDGSIKRYVTFTKPDDAVLFKLKWG